MAKAKCLPDMKINRMYSTIVGGVIATYVVIMGNGEIHKNADCYESEQIVYCCNNNANVYNHSSTKEVRMSIDLFGYNNNEPLDVGVHTMILNKEKIDNLNKISMISELPDNWNENGARAFHNSLLTKTRELIMSINMQPEIFPTACESIQLEYDKEDGSHMEIELIDDNNAEVFIIDSESKEKIISIQFTIEAINKVVNDFYG